MPHCPFCFSTEYRESYLPDTFFNKKLFHYIKCTSCELIYLNPFPKQEDYIVMYPPSYQSGVNKTINIDTKLPGLRFAYEKHFDLIKRFAPGDKILDYGCGHGNFVINANLEGFKCDGVEYNPKHVEVLQSEISSSKFYLIENFLKDNALKYDVIRLSNVLEHLENPNQIIQVLLAKLNERGILIIEGPIETNINIAQLLRRSYFGLSKLLYKERKANHPPTHIFFSNFKNQRDFFVKNSLNEIYFEIIECEWPFPEYLSEVNNISALIKLSVAKFSKFISGMNKNWGNTFIFVGNKMTNKISTYK